MHFAANFVRGMQSSRVKVYIYSVLVRLVPEQVLHAFELFCYRLAVNESSLLGKPLGLLSGLVARYGKRIKGLNGLALTRPRCFDFERGAKTRAQNQDVNDATAIGHQPGGIFLAAAALRKPCPLMVGHIGRAQ
jgi:hypothetical protein